ncbi:non-homologous end-joining DNA ligase [Variovorax soli]|uniref:DNA ligase D-like protein (Predicted polymerase)/DNA ligase D-like protein (Predicted 3'-phosphoesterase) n=1 Tax=Variovorax soli TaxID=376815 RepID=A0ABU1N952_9BURK|nr:non-homologous end-joining DNA ligase [Variovorax soli]MDR6534974.1 DNA ligase D-like protein (predicted polymerase)/DNA ligase D-like protein (predicted 3'-phosphoesterase) [Variovorax soli]
MARSPRASEALAPYRRKRDFKKTPEPHQVGRGSQRGDSFVVQKHHARQLHYDFRLELDGTLKSWAVPKGPCLDPSVKRMAVHVEDHPVSYAGFEGTIPPQQYGAGTVIVWDRGEWQAEGDARRGLAEGKLKFELRGNKLRGHWTLVRMRGKGEKQEPWLLIKEQDAHARPLADYDIVEAEPDSVLSGRDVDHPPEVTYGRKADPAPVPASPRAPAPRKQAAAAPHPDPEASPSMKALHITHAERVIDKTSGVTKGELVAYYDQVGALMLPHLKGRPVALVRAPEGVGGELFFQKHANQNEMQGVKLLDPALDPEHEPLLQIDSVRGLLSAAQMNVLELHTWNATSNAIDRPDRITLDLDPGEGVEWATMQEATLLVKTLLDELALPAFLKTSGGKGMHVVVPIRRHYGWEAVKGFAQALVIHLAETIPDRFVAKSGPRNRVGKIFVDYLRNGFGATTVSAWSARSRPGLGVSVPIEWDELPMLQGAAHWTVRAIGERLAIGNKPWAAMEKSRKGLAAAMKHMGYTPPDAP